MTQAIATELTFHYLDGRNESFTLYSHANGDAPEALRSLQDRLRHLMAQNRWVLQLSNKTVIINMNTVVKVELQPPLPPSSPDDLMAHTPSIMTFQLTSESDESLL